MKNNESAWCVVVGGRPVAHPSKIYGYLTTKYGNLVDSNEPIKSVVGIYMVQKHHGNVIQVARRDLTMLPNISIRHIENIY